MSKHRRKVAISMIPNIVDLLFRHSAYIRHDNLIYEGAKAKTEVLCYVGHTLS